jgi:hypothetical protein
MAVSLPPAVVGISLPTAPGPGETANNGKHAAAVLCQRFAADAAMAGVGQPIVVDKADATAMRCTHCVDNMDSINGINHAMLGATKLIGKAIIVREMAPPPPQPALLLLRTPAPTLIHFISVLKRPRRMT